jgi:hypothetical protein
MKHKLYMISRYIAILKAEMNEIPKVEIPLAQSNIQLSIEDNSVGYLTYIVQ